MRMAAPVDYSAEMVRVLPHDGKRYETAHGVPVYWIVDLEARN